MRIKLGQKHSYEKKEARVPQEAVLTHQVIMIGRKLDRTDSIEYRWSGHPMG